MKLLSRNFAIIIVVFATMAAFAAPAWQQRPTGYVNDLAGVLNPSTISQLENICQQVDQHGRAQIAVVTVRSLEGQDIESYAVQLFKQWGIGYKGTDRGVLILMAVQDRRYRTEVGYGLEPILPDGKVGGFWREAVPNLKAGDYSAAILLVTTRIADVIAQDSGFQISTDRTNLQPVHSQPESHSGAGIVWLILLLVIILFTPVGRGLLYAFLISSTMSRSGRGGYGGGYSGGGWGGGGFGSGGGGFGGFGGGSSGGGGASGSW